MAIDAVTALSRFGLGARQGDLAVLDSDPRGALLAELETPKVADLAGRSLLSSAEALAAYGAFRQSRVAARQQQAAGEGNEMAARNYTVRTELPARLKRLTGAPTGLAERLTLFWANHFAVESDNGGALRAMAGPFEREAIRPHVLGRFEDLLMAATRHPAMLIYLNNATSVGPQSKAGLRREAGLNENHARELMELHTLGVDGGYSQDDVIALAKILSGWGVNRNRNASDGFGQFRFAANAHEPGPQTLLGQVFAERGLAQGEAALRMLARHEATARHIATKLVRHFVGEPAPPGLVDRLGAEFLATRGDLKAVTRALIEDDGAWSAPAVRLRTPQEFVIAALRATGVTAKPRLFISALRALGQPLLNPPSPAGFADDPRTWLAPDAMTSRLEVAELVAVEAGEVDPRAVAEAVLGPRLSPLTRQTIERAESPAQGLALMLMSPEFQRR